MGIKFEKYYDINYDDVDFNLNATIISLANFISDISVRQSYTVGDGIDNLIHKGLGWVFYKYDISIKKYPKFRDKVKVITECYGFKKFYAFRKYKIQNENNEVVAEAKAIFLMIDLKKRRLLRIPKQEYEIYGFEKDLDFELQFEDIKEVENEDTIKELNVEYDEIDSNFHANNVNYLKWAINSLPKEIFENKCINKISINFLKECKHGDLVKVKSKIIDSKESIHKICDINNKKLAMVDIYYDN